MKDFGRWFAEQALPALAPAAPDLEEQLDALGHELHADGSVWVLCCRCERRYELSAYISVAEILEAAHSEHHCGGSPRCCP